MGETEVRTAETSGTVTNASAQTSQPKAKAKGGSKRAGTETPKAVRAKLNERGVPVTQWDDPAADPNLRVHVGDSPDGKANEDFKAGKAALKKS